MDTPVEKYDPLRRISHGLWCIDGDWQETAFRRRMTILATRSGDLVLHNAILLEREDLVAVGQLGRIRAVVAPNLFHGDESLALIRGLEAVGVPGVMLFTPAALLERYRKRGGTPLALETDWPEELGADIACQLIEGTRIHEVALFHAPSRTLVLTDLVFNMPADAFRGFEKIAMGWNGILDKTGGVFGPSRAMKYLFTKDRKALLRSIDALCGRDFDRVVMNHGTILENGGPQLLRESFLRRYGASGVL